MPIDFTLTLWLIAISAFAASCAMLIVARLPVSRIAPLHSVFDKTTAGSVFLFDGDVLIDSTPGGRALLASSVFRGGHWARLMAFLAPRFDNLETQLLRLPTDGMLTLTSVNTRGKGLLLQAEHAGGITRISLVDLEKSAGLYALDPLSHRAMADELDQLRETVADAPILTWRENAAGDIVWGNGGYLLLAGETLAQGQDLSWPLPRLFDRKATTQGHSGQRQCITMPDKATKWFDLFSLPKGDGRLSYALPADRAVGAETALRDFMQTLTKTFAHLPIGLAIFDRARQLQLFNPALMDLTGLPADFLSLRPTLLSVLDAMRDRNMLPEPKDYRGWRGQILNMEQAAASGLYEETWNLADGQTFRVVGRPHPNGALALMIEDISTEMLRTRRYRADLELGQSVVDEMDEAIVVFSQSGQLVMSNTAYENLWNHTPSQRLEDCTVRHLSAHWRATSAPSSVWAQVDDYVATVGDRTLWRAEARLLDGRLLACRFAPLAAGATLAAFRIISVADADHPHPAEAQLLRA